MREVQFAQALKERGWVLRRMDPDGNCLFRAFADQIYGDAEMHANIRGLCLDYLASERDHYAQYVAEDFDAYIKRKRTLGTHGNAPEIQALAELFNRPVEIYVDSLEPINIFQAGYKTDSPPIRLSYHNHEHYNSIVDPAHPAVGVGLGFPASYVPTSPGELQHALQASADADLDAQLLAAGCEASELETLEETIQRSILTQSLGDAPALPALHVQTPLIPPDAHPPPSALPSSTSSSAAPLALALALTPAALQATLAALASPPPGTCPEPHAPAAAFDLIPGSDRQTRDLQTNDRVRELCQYGVPLHIALEAVNALGGDTSACLSYALARTAEDAAARTPALPTATTTTTTRTHTREPSGG